jgi:hypothetical protein
MSASEWFHIVGFISAGALGIGFITGVISVVLSRAINREQAREIAKANVKIAELTQDTEELKNKNLALQSDSDFLQLQLTDPRRTEHDFLHLSGSLLDMATEGRGGPIPVPHRVVLPGTQRRKLTEENKRNLIPFGNEPKGLIEIICAPDDILKNEPCAFASEIADALQSAGWVIHQRESHVILPTLPAASPLSLLIDDQTPNDVLDAALRVLGLAWIDRLPSHKRRGKPPLLVVGLLGSVR